jgi:L-rhamnose-H+ transport protein
MVIGLLLTLVAGTMGGSFALPMRYMKKWAWENIWTVWSLVALILIPWLLALATVPHLSSVYRAVGPRALLLPSVFGLLWGVSSFLFGLGVDLAGMSLTFAVVNGLSSAIGSWVPMTVQHPGRVLTVGGVIASLGVLGVVSGVAVCSWAGHIRSRQKDNPGVPSDQRSRDFWRGLAVVIASGLLAPCLNLGFAFGQKISSAAVTAGGSPATSTNAVLALVLAAGFVTNFAYCLYRLVRNKSVGLYRIPESGKYFMLGIIMGALWILTFALYGSATSYYGEYGTVVGWPMLMAVVTIVSSLWDVRHGEWTKRALRVMAPGVMILILSVAVISYGLYKLQHVTG